MIGIILTGNACLNACPFDPPCKVAKDQNEPAKRQDFSGIVIDPDPADGLLFARKSISQFVFQEVKAKSTDIAEKKTTTKQYYGRENGTELNKSKSQTVN